MFKLWSQNVVTAQRYLARSRKLQATILRRGLGAAEGCDVRQSESVASRPEGGLWQPPGIPGRLGQQQSSRAVL